MAVPKRRKSKMRVRQRRGHFKADLAQVTPCPQCGAAQQAHRACTGCGQYRGRQFLTITAED